MLTKRIIPCLDVKEGKVVKGVQFKNHQVVGEILDLAGRYVQEGADELVFYDIAASGSGWRVSCEWVRRTAKKLNIPFCVAGGIRTVDDARKVLNAGAEKISINSPALERPDFINELVQIFGSQCVVVGIDSLREEGDLFVYQYTGSESKMRPAKRRTLDWVCEVQDRGAGEIVLNCMNQDGTKKGYDIEQLQRVREKTSIPLVASGGAGCTQDFIDLFQKTKVDAALAAGIFHRGEISILKLKEALARAGLEVRL